MLALPRIGVLVERRAVEAREAVDVLGKMARHPIEDHADAGVDGRRRRKYLKSSGRPWRLVGAKKPMT